MNDKKPSLKIISVIFSCTRLVADMNSFFDDGRTGDSADNVTGSDTNWKSGDVCAISDPDDRRWYRAQIKKMSESTPPTAEVRFRY